MKKIYAVLALVTILFAAGCKQDPAVVPANLQNAQLLGKWYLTSLVIDTDVDGSVTTADAITDFTDQDYFEFKTGNEAVFSSSQYGKLFKGYYSANSDASPQTLKFKSGSVLINYVLESIDDTEFVVNTSSSSTTAGSTTIITSHYTYSRTR
ncbi:hypothetical protein LLH06_16810 [Mucilaginibacter daejeonensis]|uniref:hypothetical protein n=1 Tax=Mucilaginibacter daejeonensis TaxID=398049 RepID=UPI001D17B1E2|nr:hypothetical protein [Mucilaginibacter daejeonensis]UEG52613.1 hypothetical protein LLH06_16810 [Mucilaginibacter daejeonensis]